MFDEAKELQKIRVHSLREIGYNPKKLTIVEWKETLEYFEYKCAYCLERPYETMDHFISIGAFGTTTASNCVPACKTCNGHKSFLCPHQVRSISRETIERVQRYLDTRQAPGRTANDWYTDSQAAKVYNQTPHKKWAHDLFWLRLQGYIEAYRTGAGRWLYLKVDLDYYVQHKRPRPRAEAK